MAALASGSSGNCICVGSDRTHILVDAGISNKRIEQGLHDMGVDADELSGVMITHEHSDHIKGLRVLVRKHRVPIYASAGTIRAMRGMKEMADIPEELLITIEPDCPFTVGDLQVEAFSIDHDAAQPVAYRVQNGSKAMAVATDMGHFNDYIVAHLQRLDCALIEANHDVRMLEAGSYPYVLKRRILSDHGHLSNENSGRLIAGILHDGLRHIFLGHLSQENNYPELAYETVKLEIDESQTPYRGGDFDITVARRDQMSEIITV